MKVCRQTLLCYHLASTFACLLLLYSLETTAWHVSQVTRGSSSQRSYSSVSAPRFSVHSKVELIQEPDRLRLDTAVEELQRRLEENCTNLVQIEGYVTAKRGFGASFCFLDLSEKGQATPVQAMLKRQEYLSPEAFDAYMKCMLPGVRICLIGPAAPTRNPGEALVQAQKIQILGLPRNPQHARIILQLTANGQLPIQEVALVAHMSPNELSKTLQKEQLAEHEKPFNGLAKQILACLPQDEKYPEISSERHAYSLPVPPPDIQCPPSVDMSMPCITDADEPLSVNDVYEQGLSNKPASLVAWVQNRRRFRDYIAVLEVGDDNERRANEPSDSDRNEASTTRNQRIKCVMHPSVMGSKAADIYRRLLAPGSQVLLDGYLVCKDDTLVYWIEKACLLQASWRPSVINYMMESVVDTIFDVKEAAKALQIPEAELNDLLNKDLTERQWKAAEISRNLQGAHSRMASVSPDVLSTLDRFKDIRDQFPAIPVDVKLDYAGSRHGSRWKRKKEPQLEWMARQVQSVVRSHPDFGKRPLKILDVGGGKGHLANMLASFLSNDMAEVHVIDIAQGAIKNGAMRSRRRQLHVKYTVGDASVANFDGDLDVVVALHACGALTDVALGHAAANGAVFVICPCCFRSNSHLRVLAPTEADGALRNNLVSVEEWLGVDAADYNSLKLLAEIQGDLSLASQAIHSICALRAAAAERHSIIPTNVAVRTFPISYSTRNFCLVGSFPPTNGEPLKV